MQMFSKQPRAAAPAPACPGRSTGSTSSSGYGSQPGHNTCPGSAPGSYRAALHLQREQAVTGLSRPAQLQQKGRAENHHFQLALAVAYYMLKYSSEVQ